MPRRRKTRKQRGGALLDTGSFGTVFRPAPCLQGSMPDEVAWHPENYVGKLMNKKKADEELAQVRKIQDIFFMRRRIPGRSRKYPKIDTEHFYLHYAGKCIPNTLNPDLYGIKTKHKKLLLYKYGGTPFYKFYTGLLQRQGRTPEKMNIQFKNFMAQCSGLLYGVRSLSQLGIVHADIKNDNIVVGEQTFPKVGAIRLIDFGNSFMARDVNNLKNLFTNQQINATYWPLECCVSLTGEGLENILSTNLDDTRNFLFTDDKTGNTVRLEYLAALGKPISTEEEILESQEKVVEDMRDGVATILDKVLHTKDADGDFEYEEYFHIFEIKAIDKTTSFNIDAMDYYLQDIDSVKHANNDAKDDFDDKADFLGDLEEEVRAICIRKLDVFSVGLEVYEMLTDIVENCQAQEDPDNNWMMSPDILGYYTEIKFILRKMIEPNVAKRISIEEAYNDYIHTSLFGGAPAADYLAAVAAGLI